jgi:hypothetical protein
MKLLIKHQKNKKSTKCFNQKRGVKRAPVIPIRPVYEAAAHVARVQQHLTGLQLINGAYSDSTLSNYRDGEASIGEKKVELRKSMKQVGAALAAWHCRTLDLLQERMTLKANLTDQHAELTRALAYFGGPRIN